MSKLAVGYISKKAKGDVATPKWPSFPAKDRTQWTSRSLSGQFIFFFLQGDIFTTSTSLFSLPEEAKLLNVASKTSLLFTSIISGQSFQVPTSMTITKSSKQFSRTISTVFSPDFLQVTAEYQPLIFILSLSVTIRWLFPCHFRPADTIPQDVVFYNHITLSALERNGVFTNILLWTSTDCVFARHNQFYRVSFPVRKPQKC